MARPGCGPGCWPPMHDDMGHIQTEPMTTAFGGFTGRGVKVAVIDSGVYPAHAHIGRVAGGVAVTPRGEIVTGDDAFIDHLGHGTAVMAAIQEKAPDAECWAVKVFDDALKATATAL